MNALLKAKTVPFFRFVILTIISVVGLFSLSACSGGGNSPLLAAPKILTQPSNQSVRVGEAASFSVVASGDGNLAYQWKRNGMDVAGANAVTYAISSPQLPDTASVSSVAVSNASGSVTSAGATLTVKPALGISLLAGTLNIAGTRMASVQMPVPHRHEAWQSTRRAMFMWLTLVTPPFEKCYPSG